MIHDTWAKGSYISSEEKKILCRRNLQAMCVTEVRSRNYLLSLARVTDDVNMLERSKTGTERLPARLRWQHAIRPDFSLALKTGSQIFGFLECCSESWRMFFFFFFFFFG